MGEQLYKIRNSKIELQNLKIIMLFKNTDHNIEKIYQNIVEISRSKFFYIDFELDDSFETRFDLIIFHAFMIFYFIKVKILTNHLYHKCYLIICSMILKIILEKWDLEILLLIKK